MKPTIEYRPSKVSTPKLRDVVKRQKAFGAGDVNAPVIADPKPAKVSTKPGDVNTVYLTDAQAELARRRKLKADQMKRYRAKRKAKA